MLWLPGAVGSVENYIWPGHNGTQNSDPSPSIEMTDSFVCDATGSHSYLISLAASRYCLASDSLQGTRVGRRMTFKFRPSQISQKQQRSFPRMAGLIFIIEVTGLGNMLYGTQKLSSNLGESTACQRRGWKPCSCEGILRSAIPFSRRSFSPHVSSLRTAARGPAWRLYTSAMQYSTSSKSSDTTSDQPMIDPY